jgi:hypothetical protein
MCSLPESTLLRALDLSEKLATIPGLTTTLIKNYLPCSTATNKEHMRCHQANTTSTRNMQANIIAALAQLDCMFPLKKSVLCKICSALPHSPMPQWAPCIPTSLAPSRYAPSKVCNMCLLPTSMTLVQSSSGPCHLVLLRPRYKH